MIKLKTFSTEQTEKIGEDLSKELKGTEIIALYGKMGVGKTAFVRGLARGLNISDSISSPTFSIVHEYQGTHKLFHFDMYRVTSLEDLYSTGFFDYINTGILVIEWSENIENVIPKSSLKICIESKGETERIITIEGADKL